jgi:L-lactate dehydrogenase complex protein LldG
VDPGSDAVSNPSVAGMNTLFDALLEEFRLKAEPLGVVVHHVHDDAGAAAVMLAWEQLSAASSAVISSDVARELPGLVEQLAVNGVEIVAAESPEQVRDRPVGLSIAQAAVAETGSTLLAETSLGDRSVGMLSQAQIIIVPASALLPTLDDGAIILQENALRVGASFQTLVTGPSRTADIERVLTVGVQGPGKVMVIFVDSLGNMG